MKPLTEWACHLKAFIISDSVAPPARDNSFSASSRTVAPPEAVFFFAVLPGLRPDVAFLQAAVGFRATLGLSAGSGLRIAQIRVTVTSRDSNF